MRQTSENALEIDLFVAEEAAVEELFENGAAGFGTAGTLSCAGSVTGCLGTASTASSTSPW
ncbi:MULTISPECIES: thiocillin family RiPP [unclassified Streptomyces]|uniref:thiocillin family RiPP n=1 Tax=unclassified Streptomyces TaxID=2593676 RepID=UPI002E2EB338|nr:thiocillin family RiPP [Streptomyces sp. NBC_01278]